MIYLSDLETISKFVSKIKNKAIIGEDVIDDISELENIVNAILSTNGYGKISKSEQEKTK